MRRDGAGNVPRADGRPRVRLDRADGVASTELVVAFPAVLLIVSLALQFALYLHAAQIAEAAAQEAVDAAQGQTDDDARGHRAASALLMDLPALRRAEVRVTRAARSVTARVDGSAPALLPGLDLTISATATGPVERFVPADGP